MRVVVEKRIPDPLLDEPEALRQFFEEEAREEQAIEQAGFTRPEKRCSVLRDARAYDPERGHPGPVEVCTYVEKRDEQKALDDLAVVACRAAAIAEEAGAVSSPETVFRGIEAAAESLRRGDPNLTKAQAIARVIEHRPELYAEYSRAVRPSTAARQAYVAKVVEWELEPLTEALRKADPSLSHEAALARAFELFPAAYSRYRSLAENLPHPIEKSEAGAVERQRELAQVVERARKVRKAADGVPVDFAEAFRQALQDATLDRWSE